MLYRQRRQNICRHPRGRKQNAPQSYKLQLRGKSLPGRFSIIAFILKQSQRFYGTVPLFATCTHFPRFSLPHCLPRSSLHIRMCTRCVLCTQAASYQECESNQIRGNTTLNITFSVVPCKWLVNVISFYSWSQFLPRVQQSTVVK